MSVHVDAHVQAAVAGHVQVQPSAVQASVQVQAIVHQAAAPPRNSAAPTTSIVGGPVLGPPAGGAGVPPPAASPQVSLPPAPQPPPAAPRPQSASTLMAVTCPANCKGGDPLNVMAHGRRFALTIPMGVLPGQIFRVHLAAPNPPPPVPQVVVSATTAPSSNPGFSAAAAGMVQGTVQGIVHQQQSGMILQRPPILQLQPGAVHPTIAALMRQPAQPKPKPQPRQIVPKPPPAPPPPPPKPPVKVALELIAPHAVRDANKDLIIDKRSFSTRIHVKDANGEPTSALLALMATLVYEDFSSLPPEAQASALGGTTTAVSGQRGPSCTLKLRMNIVSSNTGGARFRVRISPQDLGFAKANPGLVTHTEAFQVVTHSAKVTQSGPGRPSLGGGSSSGGFNLGGPRPTIVKPSLPAPSARDMEIAASSSNVAIAAAALARRRYFPAEGIRAATAPPPDLRDSAPELSRTGVAALDRLAAMVTQQLTHRAWQHARKQRAGTRQLSGADVASIARRGVFDVLHEAGVTGEWLVVEEEPAAEAQPPPAATAQTNEPPAPPAEAMVNGMRRPEETAVPGGSSAGEAPEGSMLVAGKNTHEHVSPETSS